MALVIFILAKITDSGVFIHTSKARHGCYSNHGFHYNSKIFITFSHFEIFPRGQVDVMVITELISLSNLKSAN